MKKVVIGALLMGAVLFGNIQQVHAAKDTTKVEQAADTAAKASSTDSVKAETTATTPLTEEKSTTPTKEVSFHQIIKDRFIEGGVGFMSIVLACLIIGLAVAIERIIALNLATTNVDKLLAQMKDALQTGGVQKAREVCVSLPGPVASIFAQGLLRADQGAEAVEKSILQYGSVEMGKLEKGLSWVSLFIALAPMFGFMGTVLGMIEAFDKIAIADDISAAIVADGIKVALLTTVAGLIVAVILQVFYNYCVHKIDAVVNQMEESSISFVDLLIAHNILKK